MGIPSRNQRYSPCPSCRAKGKDQRGDNLVHFPDGGAHCFSCGFHEGAKRRIGPGIRLAPNDSRRHGERLVDHGTTCLPLDFTREVPARALQWLYGYGLPWSYWKESCGYSPSQERLVLTYGDPIVASVGRYVGDGDYPRWRAWGRPQDYPLPIGDEHERLVLVEDLVSAHKVAAAGYQTLPLFGAKLTPPQMRYLIKAKKPMVLWLDKDQEDKLFRHVLRIGSLTLQPVTKVTTTKDPKALQLTAIKELLG